MSVVGVNALGQKISTKIRQAFFDTFNVEAFMYMGEQAVPMYTHAMKRSTWSQIGWTHLGSDFGEDELNRFYTVNEGGAVAGKMDYLLASSVEAVFPQITLVNTLPPVSFSTLFGINAEEAPVASDITEGGAQLFFYLSNGDFGLPAGTLYVGTRNALLTLTEGALSTADIRPFISYSPRHRVGWGMNPLIAAIEEAAFYIDAADYEVLSRHAIYNALQFRTREDVFPVAVEEATSFDAKLLPANVGVGDEVVLGSPSEDERYKAFVLPFSFTTSALADRGENGKHKSAFPVMLACRNNIGIRIRTIDDLRNLLVLEEEVLIDYSGTPVSFVATGEELALANGVATASPFFSDGMNVYNVPSAGFQPMMENLDLFVTGLNGSNFVVTTNGVPVTFGMNSPFTIEGFNALYLEQTGEYLPVTRQSDDSLPNPFSQPVNYENWIREGPLQLPLRVRALGAVVTALERGMMKADCRSKKWLYEKYWYAEQSNVRAGAGATLDIENAPGAFKYAYTFAQNDMSRLQGHYFNYTNTTDYTRLLDEDLVGVKWAFDGKDSLREITTRIQGNTDESHPTGFYRYADNGLFAQRLPRVKGLHIAPRYGNFINAIYPDGSINPQAIGDVSVSVRTTPPAHVCTEVSLFYGHPNTFGYNVQTIGVAWNLALFELAKHYQE